LFIFSVAYADVETRRAPFQVIEARVGQGRVRVGITRPTDHAEVFDPGHAP